MKKRIVTLILALSMLIGASSACFAANGGTAVNVSEEMCKASFWSQDQKLLMNFDDIAKFNEEARLTKEAYITDFDQYNAPYDAYALGQSLAKLETPSYDVYIDGVKIDKESYFNSIRNTIAGTMYYERSRYVQYAVAVKNADIKAVPLDVFICDSTTDTADEMQTSALLVNEPFVILQKCEMNGKRYYYGFSENVPGWVAADNLAICSSKEEWLDAWKISDIAAKDFIVVCDDKITLENSMFKDYPSGLKLLQGTILKLVPENERPERVAERGTWHNHVVYLPTRDAQGKYVKSVALISQNDDINVGFVSYTEANTLELAFKHLGNRYGWGNMLEDLDCSGYVRNIYRCMGFTMPRNTTRQVSLSSRNIDITDLSDEAKIEILKTIPAGSTLFFPGHIMIYLGIKDNVPYCISSAATLSDSADAGDLYVTKMLGVLVTPLTVRRANTSTWLSSLKTIVIMPEKAKLSLGVISAEKYVKAADDSAKVSLTLNGKTLKVGKDYSLEFANGKAISIAKPASGVIGSVRCTIAKKLSFADVPADAEYYDALLWAVEKGYINGYSAAKFAPDMIISEEIANIICERIYGESYSADKAGWMVPGESTRAQAVLAMYEELY